MKNLHEDFAIEINLLRNSDSTKDFFKNSLILYIITTVCVCVRPSDDVLAAFSVAEPATENYLSYFVLSRAGRPGQPLGGVAGGGWQQGWPLAFFNSYLFTVYISVKSS
jgi:hypothetical protein